MDTIISTIQDAILRWLDTALDFVSGLDSESVLKILVGGVIILLVVAFLWLVKGE